MGSSQSVQEVHVLSVWIHHSQQSAYHLVHVDFFPTIEGIEFKALLCSSNSIYHLMP